MNRIFNLLVIALVAALIFLGNSIIGDVSSYQGSIVLPLQNTLIPPVKLPYEGKEGEVELSLRAEYDVRGVMKGKRKYSDYSSQVSQYDVILVWGDLNKEEYDQYINYSQSGRWYYYSFQEDMIEKDFIAKYSANMHLIPENEDILKKIRKLRENDYVRILGYLVDVRFSDGVWETSMTRGDSGNGACEIIYVTDIHIVD